MISLTTVRSLSEQIFRYRLESGPFRYDFSVSDKAIHACRERVIEAIDREIATGLMLVKHGVIVGVAGKPRLFGRSARH